MKLNNSLVTCNIITKSISYVKILSILHTFSEFTVGIKLSTLPLSMIEPVTLESNE